MNDKKNIKTQKPMINKPTSAKDNTPRIDSLTAGFLKKKENYDRQATMLRKRLESSKAGVERLKNIIVQTEGKLATLVGPDIKSDFIEPIAQELLKLVPTCDSYAATEAMGQQQAVTVCLFEKGATEQQKINGEKCKSVTFVTKTDSGRLSVRNFQKVIDPSIKPGSLAFASGLQFEAIPMPEEAHISWLLDRLK